MILIDHVLEVRAVCTVNHHASAARDVAHNFVGRHRMTAAGKLCEQGIHADHEHLALTRRARSSAQHQIMLRSRRRSGLWRLYGLCECGQRDFFLGKSHAELINGAKAQAFGKIIELNRG